MTVGISGSTVGLAVRVDCHEKLNHEFHNPFLRICLVLKEVTVRHTVRASRSAAVGVITELVNVESTLSVGVVTGDVPGDGGGSTLLGLLEGDSTGDLCVSAQDSN